MKKLLLTLVIFAITLNVTAQNDVTKFLGIPVDGTKSEMLQELKAKGFTSSPYDNEILEGEFNGKLVRIYILTNNNKVYRIGVYDAYSISSYDIISRFYTLLSQFKNNDKYTELTYTIDYSDTAIKDNNEVDSRIFDYLLNNNDFQPIFAQEPENNIMEKIRPALLKKYTAEQIANPDFSVLCDINIEKLKYIETAKKLVWFKIIKEESDKYKIVIFYDNEYNRANGEDL